MSEVISFRLDPDNAREAQALVLLSAWAKKGYSIRYVITDALINFGEGNGVSISTEDTEKITSALDKITQLIDSIHLENGSVPIDNTKSPETAQINGDFITSLKKTVKPGLKI